MEYIHLKDMRASGLEPIDILSEYKWQDGLGYYQATKDIATHFFFDELFASHLLNKRFPLHLESQ